MYFPLYLTHVNFQKGPIKGYCGVVFKAHKLLSQSIFIIMI